MIENDLHIQMGRKKEEDEKELLFFISDEYENERDEDNKIVDPCHQNLLRLLDRLLLATGIFIAIVICTAITIVLCSRGSGFHYPHSLDITMKSNAPNLPHSQSFYITRKTIYLQDSGHLEVIPTIQTKSLILCNNLKRKSVMSNFNDKESNYYSSNDFKNIFNNFVDVMYRNSSNIVSPLDQINHCDINAFQPNILTILPSDDILKHFTRDKGYNGNNVETLLKLLASQYDEEDAILSVGEFPDNVLSSTVNCNYSSNFDSTPHVYIDTLERMRPLDANDFHKSCNTLTLSSSSASMGNLKTTRTRHNTKSISFDQTSRSFNTRMILNGEIYDNDNVNTVEEEETSSQPSFELQIIGSANNNIANQSYSLQSVNIMPGYKTDVSLDGCIQREENERLSNGKNVVNMTISLSQTVEISPWFMSTTETMLVFGRVGYRLQKICTDKRNIMRKRSLEDTYEHICEEISAIQFKENGESNIAKVALESDGEKVAPGTNVILAYIRDNISFVNIYSHIDNEKYC